MASQKTQKHRTFDGGAAKFQGGAQAPLKKKTVEISPAKTPEGVGGGQKGFAEIRDALLCAVLLVMLSNEFLPPKD